jgi:hypothetical protein
MALFMRTPVYRVIHEIRTHTAIVEQRIALGRRSITDNPFPFLPCRNQEGQEFSLGGLDLRTKRKVVIQPAESGGLFFQFLGNPGLDAS